MDFGVRPAPLPNDIGISDFMEWIDTEFKALPGVISGASDFAAPSRSKVFWSCFVHLKIRPNEDVLAIKVKFAREFWLTSGREVVKNIARAKLDQVDL
jgi:hypothetical protein